MKFAKNHQYLTKKTEMSTHWVIIKLILFSTFLGYKAPDLNVQYEWSPIPRDSDYYFDIPYTEYYDYYNDIDYDIPPASEPSYYTEPKITPKPYQYYIPNTTTSTYSNYPIEDLFPSNLQTVADDRQDTSIIFGVPVANFGVS